MTTVKRPALNVIIAADSDKSINHVSKKQLDEKPRTRDQGSSSGFSKPKNAIENVFPCNSSRESSNKLIKLDEIQLVDFIQNYSRSRFSRGTMAM